MDYICTDKLITDAAAAIEELQDIVQAQDKALKECARQLANSVPKRGDLVEVVRCGECIYYHKPHVRLNDGTEAGYDSEIVREHMQKNAEKGDLFIDFVTCDFGINVGGKCEYEKNSGYLEDKTVFRNKDDFCSRGKKMEVQE